MLKERLALLGFVPRYMQCSYKKRKKNKKESRAMAAVPPVYTTLMYQYWDIAQLTSYMHMGKTRPAKKTEYCRGAGAD